MENPKFELRASANSQYYFLLKARNGEIILKASETYTTKQNCQNGINAVRENAPYDQRYNRNDSLNNNTFNLQASNGRILGNSESYPTRQARENGIEAVKRDAPTAPVQDFT